MTHPDVLVSPTDLRPGLPPMPARIAKLRRHNGWPVPWFVADVDGIPDFRVTSARKRESAHKQKHCWVCGDRLGAHLVFVLGPMCGITRSTTELPCHRECAIWSAKACPFLSRPKMIRREAGMPEEALPAPGMGIPRNPGVALLWATKKYKRFAVADGWMIEVGEPEDILWFAEGRLATHDEVAESIRTGLPILEETAKLDGEEGEKELAKRVQVFLSYSGITL